jgi:CcmD family protein
MRILDCKKLKMVTRPLLLAFLTLVLVHGTFPVFAHSPETDFMQSIGKIYVVVAVLLAALAGTAAYLFYLDRRLSKIENQIKEHE